jgi:4-diphosphocytidyl-2-C-methyl-D-erythritol kinase
LPPAHPRRAADSGAGAALVEPAAAKVNLYLHVTGRRADGYHLLDSLVAFADDGDVVSAEPAEELSLRIEGPFARSLEAEPDNLVLRAARLLSDTVKPDRGATLTLTKTLPVASGLGGGSADAAATLRLLCRLWSIDPRGVPLFEIAQSLGADVPVCLKQRAAFLGGIGEQLDPAPALPKAGLVLVNPRVPLATPAVFAARTGEFTPPARFTQAPRDAAELAALLRVRDNSLTRAAIALVPAVGDVLDALASSPGCLLTRMSGSGVTCFGLYGDPGQATVAARWLAARKPEWWVLATSLRDAAEKPQ